MDILSVLDIEQSSLDRLPAIVEPLLSWFRIHARPMAWRENPDPYWVWISEIMLQQTRVEAVRDYFDRFVTALPTIQALAEVPEEKLLKLWEGLGYYTRARNLKKAALVICEKHQGRLPAEFDQLLQLPGIGEYTAGAIASNVFGLAIPAVDGNVYRVISRLLASYTMINTTAKVKRAYFKIVGDIVPLEQPGQFNQALMELGATVCIPNGAPHCEDCPLQEDCRAFALGIQQELPVRPSKKPRTLQDRTILLVTSPQGILLSQRPEKGLLANLWEPMNLEGHLTATEVTRFLHDLNLAPVKIEPLNHAIHIFSHIEWHMQGYHISTTSTGSPENFRWVRDFSSHSLPSAFREYTKNLPELLARRKEPL